ncbi:MAG: hypothetical protein D6E12_03680 [Desulfovibrio sp.]|nr:MAG: hypothetical protein D6E12_03680 [Desulfovibrio sp.]
MKKILFLALALVIGLCGCGTEVLEEGVVAKVNGRPIYLNQLEAKYDLVHLGWTGGITPSVARLKREYGQILSELIIQELVFQVLEEKRMPVTEEEVDEAEALIRADYPEGVFEELLIEEYIDYGVWRQQLRAFVAQQKFMREILRPRIRVESEEADEYYRQHLDEFFLPARVHFLLIMGPDEDMVAEAALLYRAVGDVDKVHEQMDQVSFQDLNMRRDRLPESWNNALLHLPMGDVSSPTPSQGGFEALLLLERIPEQTLDPPQAYPIVEAILMEQKIDQAFIDWLEQEIEDSEILVSAHLRPTEEDLQELAEIEQESFTDDTLVYDYGEGMGRLFVNPEPQNATIKIMNIRPRFVQGIELEEGEYIISVELEGYTRWEESTYVYAGQDTILDVPLDTDGDQPGDGDDAEMGEDQDGAADAAAEAAESEAEEPEGEANYEGESATAPEEAEPGMGRLYVDTTPEECQIRVLNIAPRFHQGIELVPGEYVVDVQHDGYATQVVTVTVDGDGDTRVEVVLEAEGQEGGGEGELPATP